MDVRSPPTAAPTLAPSSAELACNLLTSNDKKSLRLVSRAFRSATSVCFSRISVTRSSAQLKHDLLDIWPKIDSLIVHCHSGNPARDLPRIVDHIPAGSKDALASITTLHLHADSWCTAGMAELARRCTSLQTLHLTLPCLEATFKGQGATPSEQRAHLLQQLASPAALPTLLYPPAWLTLNCLMQLSLTLDDNLGSTTAEQLGKSLVHPAQLRAVEPLPENLLRALPSLTTLTALHLRHENSTDVRDVDGVCCQHAVPAIPHLSQLQRLTISCSRFCSILDSNISPGFWTNSSLTHLTLEPTARLGLLSDLRNLRHLQVDDPVNAATQLYSLTSLSYLGLGASYAEANLEDELGYMSDSEPDDEDEEAIAEFRDLTIPVPDAWCEGLQHLRWLYNRRLNPDALRTLTALTCLELSKQPVTTELVWALSQLPRLHTLTYSEVSQGQSGQDWSPPPWQLLPPAARPALESLRLVNCVWGSLSLVNVLAQHSTLPAWRKLQLLITDKLLPRRSHGYSCEQVIVQHCSPCWLRAILSTQLGELVHRGNTRWCLKLGLRTEQDVWDACQAICSVAEAAAGGHVTLPVVLQVAQDLRVDALQQLVVAASCLCSCWSLEGWGGSWLAAALSGFIVPLADVHVLALRPGSLRSVHAITLSARSFSMGIAERVFNAAPGLKELVVHDAAQLHPGLLALLCPLCHRHRAELSLRVTRELDTTVVAALASLAVAAGAGFKLCLLWESAGTMPNVVPNARAAFDVLDKWCSVVSCCVSLHIPWGRQLGPRIDLAVVA